jgi:hypothetical protein
LASPCRSSSVPSRCRPSTSSAAALSCAATATGGAAPGAASGSRGSARTVRAASSVAAAAEPRRASNVASSFLAQPGRDARDLGQLGVVDPALFEVVRPQVARQSPGADRGTDDGRRPGQQVGRPDQELRAPPLLGGLRAVRRAGDRVEQSDRVILQVVVGLRGAQHVRRCVVTRGCAPR